MHDALKIYTNQYFNKLITSALFNNRLRQHSNIHESYEEPCQRFFNAINVGSYIRPHRHFTDYRDELLVAVSGQFALFTFECDGTISGAVILGTEKFQNSECMVVEVPGNIWHTVLALEPGSVLLEIKAGPFNPQQPKDLALWAPDEDSELKNKYLSQLHDFVTTMLSK